MQDGWKWGCRIGGWKRGCRMSDGDGRGGERHYGLGLLLLFRTPRGEGGSAGGGGGGCWEGGWGGGKRGKKCDLYVVCCEYGTYIN